MSNAVIKWVFKSIKVFFSGGENGRLNIYNEMTPGQPNEDSMIWLKAPGQVVTGPWVEIFFKQYFSDLF